MKRTAPATPTCPALRQPGHFSPWSVFLVTVFLLLGREIAQAQTFNGLAYTANADSTIKITGFNCASSVVVIPDGIEGLPVTTIANRTFSGCTRCHRVLKHGVP